MELKYLKEYAAVLLDAALKIEKGDRLILMVPSIHESFCNILKERATLLGVSEMHIIWEDQSSECAHYMSGRTDKYTWIEEETFERLDQMIENGAKLLFIRSTHFGIFDTLTPEQKKLQSNYHMQDFGRLYYYVQGNLVTYCLGAMPNVMWAKKMYPDLNEQEALLKLWDKMSRAIYLDTEDPSQNWILRSEELNRRQVVLNEQRFEALVIEGEGTSLKLDLDERHLWHGGILKSLTGQLFIPNIPTEEVFTTPFKLGVDGVITINHPFYFDGIKIDRYVLKFEGGRCISVDSDNATFSDKYMQYLKKHDNGDYLGEIALVTNDAGVKQQNTFFYDMVYDENASCHFAFGNSYKSTLLNGEELDDETFESYGGNISDLHMDFMYDSENMSIFGIKGMTKTLILDHGNWRL